MSLPHITLLVLALYMVQIFLQETTRYRFSLRLIIGNRDNPPSPSLLAARFDRAKNNLLEALPFFLGLTFLNMIIREDTTVAATGALVFLLARIVYVPAYLSGVPWVRSLIWLVANAGLLIMVWPLI